MAQRGEASTARSGAGRMERARSGTGPIASARSGSRRGTISSHEVGEETGLPLIVCPLCGLEKVLELKVVTDEKGNRGRTFFKCPRNIHGAPGRCRFYEWTRGYLTWLVDLGIIKINWGDHEAGREEAADSVGGHPRSASSILRRRESCRRRFADFTDPSSGLLAMGSPRTLAALTNDLLVEIFIRISSPADLVRASTACVAFRRLIADPSFLRRYRSVHPPLLLGLLDPYGDLEPTEAPHPSAALADTAARAANLRFHEYFPRNTVSNCYVWNVRGGRVLVSITHYLEDDEDEKLVPDLAVWDPLARVCLPLPPIPDDLLASVQVQQQYLELWAAFLLPSGDEEDDTSFRVVSIVNWGINSAETAVAFIFSSATGHWSAGSPVTRDWGYIRTPPDDTASYAYGCFYWKVESENKLLKLNSSSLEFSVVDLPPGQDRSYVVMVEAGKGRLGMFSLINDATTLCYNIRQIGNERSNQLEMESVIPLPEDYIYFRIHGSYEGHILIFGYAWHEDACFALEIKTMKIERVCRKWRGFYPYFVFLPSMPQRRIIGYNVD